MDCTGMVRAGSVLIDNEERRGDLVAAAMDCHAGRIRVAYGTRGETTRDAFGSPWRVSFVSVAEKDANLLAGLLSGPCVEVASLGSALRGFFSNEEVQLSDLMDVMDAAGIVYEYACADEDGVAGRTEIGQILEGLS